MQPDGSVPGTEPMPAVRLTTLCGVWLSLSLSHACSHLVAHVHGDVDETFRSLDESGDGAPNRR